MRSLIALALTGFAVFVGSAVTIIGTANGTIGDPLPIIMFVLGLSQVAVVFYFNKNRGE